MSVVLVVRVANNFGDMHALVSNLDQQMVWVCGPCPPISQTEIGGVWDNSP